MATETPQQSQAPKRRRRELVPIATCKIRTGPGTDDAIQPGDEIVDRSLLKGLTEKKPNALGKLPPIYHYEMGSYVGAGESAA